MDLLATALFASAAWLAVLWYVWHGGASRDRKAGLVAACLIATLIAFSIDDQKDAGTPFVAIIIVVVAMAVYDWYVD